MDQSIETRLTLLENHCFGNSTSSKRSPTSLVYVGMAADILHHGHVNIINTASKYGRVVVGLLTDEAIESYKRKPKVTWEKRRLLVEAIQGVHLVVPQTTLDYRPNMRLLRPAFVVHGDDWKTGVQKKIREDVITTLKKWKGKLIEPKYTSRISSSLVKKKVLNKWS